MSEELKKLEEILANDREIIEENYKEIERLTKVEQEHQRINGELREENKRINNIINELEKDMNRDDLSYVETQYVLDKLHELKGEDKE